MEKPGCGEANWGVSWRCRRRSAKCGVHDRGNKKPTLSCTLALTCTPNTPSRSSAEWTGLCCLTSVHFEANIHEGGGSDPSSMPSSQVFVFFQRYVSSATSRASLEASAWVHKGVSQYGHSLGAEDSS